MKYSFKRLSGNIIAQISFLLCLFLISYAGLKVGHRLLNQRQTYLQSLLTNQQGKLELSHILQKKLLVLHVKLHEISNAASIAEMNYILSAMHDVRAEITEILQVIEKGGDKKISHSVNFGNEEKVSRTFSYVNYAHDYIDLEVIELRAKLAELDDIVLNLKASIENKVHILQINDPLKIAVVDRKVSNYLKGIEPFFLRILENSYRLYYTSQQEAERIKKINDKFSQAFIWIDNTVTVFSVGFVLLLGWVVLGSSKKIILERQNYQQKLQKINENLENTVHKRTVALKNEISERKSAERLVKNHADFLRNIIESLAHPFYVIDVANYSIVLANSAAQSNENKSCTTCYSLTHHLDSPCDGSEHPCPLQLVKQTRSPVMVEHVHQNSQKQDVYVEVHGYPVFDENGNLIQMIEYSLDITEKKNAEKALKLLNDQLEETVRNRTWELEEQILQRKQAQLTLIKSERYFRRLIENVSDIISILDEDGIVLYSSPSTEVILGVAPEKLVGMYIGDLVLAEDLRDITISALYELHSDATPMEYRIQDRTGKIRVVESIIQKFQQDDGANAYILCSRDITMRKNSEQEAHKLKMVVEQSPSSVVITDIDGIIEYVNPAFEEVTGYSFADAIGQNPRILKSEKTSDKYYEQLWKTIKAGHVWRGEFVNKMKNGQLYDENVLVIPIKNNKDEITNFVAVKENITELKKARRLAERANQAKSNFLSQMSHELRTPLNAINGFSRLMLKSKKNPLNEKQRDMVGQINTAGQHLLQLINEVLDLARIESGELNLAIEALDPHIFLNDSLSLISSLAKERDIKIIRSYEGKKLSRVRADLTKVKQILINILSNSVKYNKSEGCVTIDVEMDTPEFLCFSVTDTGIGIPEEKQKDLFTPFTRALDNPNDIEGTGIGMTITKQLVEKMGGEIGFESHLNQGSRFWFTLRIDEVDLASENTNMFSKSNNDAATYETSS